VTSRPVPHDGLVHQLSAHLSRRACRRGEPHQSCAARRLHRGGRRARAAARARGVAHRDARAPARASPHDQRRRVTAGPAPATARLLAAIKRLAFGDSLDADSAADAFDVIMRGEATAAQVAALLMALRIKGETADEVTGAARALRGAMVALPSDVPDQ